MSCFRRRFITGDPPSKRNWTSAGPSGDGGEVSFATGRPGSTTGHVRTAGCPRACAIGSTRPSPGSNGSGDWFPFPNCPRSWSGSTCRRSKTRRSPESNTSREPWPDTRSGNISWRSGAGPVPTVGPRTCPSRSTTSTPGALADRTGSPT